MPKPSGSPNAHRTNTGKFHPRSLHNSAYPFPELILAHPPLGPFIYPLEHANAQGKLTLDFANPKAVTALNTALLKHYYQLTFWEIPEGALCPPIPGRADYIHHIAEFIETAECPSSPVKMLDIGTGANGIYCILASQIYGWQCTGSDISHESLDNVRRIIDENQPLQPNISVRHQPDKHAIFEGIIQENETYTISVCNPPFHASEADAIKSNTTKTTNLGLRQPSSDTLNFGGTASELWCNGGEKLFLRKMIKESQRYQKQVGWFTSLVSKADNVAPSLKLIRKLGATSIKDIPMHHGNKKTRVIAWSFIHKTTP